MLSHGHSILHFHTVFTEYLGIRHEAKHLIVHFIQQQQKYSVFTGIVILIIYVPKQDKVYCIIFQEITVKPSIKAAQDGGLSKEVACHKR